MRAFFPSAKKSQQGVSAVEFAFVAAFLIIALFGIIEFGRLFFTINSVQEITRRAAREQVVNKFDQTTIDAVRHVAVLNTDGAPPGGTVNFPNAGSTGTVNFPGSPDITNAYVRISFLRDNFSEIPPNDLPEDNVLECSKDKPNNCIKFVRARLAVNDLEDAPRVPFNFIALFGFGPPIVPFGIVPVDQDYLLPYSEVTMPAEGLGLL
jgi:hypothetical protein